MTVTRRTAIGGAAALLPLMCGVARAATDNRDRFRLVLTQWDWTDRDSSASLRARLLAVLPADAAGAAATRGEANVDAVPTVVVLPPARRAGGPVSVGDLRQRLSAVARLAGVYLAAAATVRAEAPAGTASGAVRTESFLFGRDGALLLRSAKITPDVLAGFSDATATLDQPAEFPVARLPFANVGLLIGEDLFRPAHVRSLCFNGAELVINCAAEVADAALATRRDVMTSIAYCHMAYVAVATGATPSRTGLWDWTGSAATASGADAVTMLLDIDRLRRARHDGLRNTAYASRILPPMVRDAVYGPKFAANARSGRALRSPTSRADWEREAARRIAAQAARRTPQRELLPAYDALLMQTPHRAVTGAADRKAAIAQNMRDFLALAEPYARRPLSKLVMFGEFAFTGAGFRTIPDALSVALSWPGPELEQLAEFAARHRVYLAAEQLEQDAKFPGRVFNTAFLFDDSGRLASRHRKLQCVDLLGTLPDTTPGSIYDRYVTEYGADSLWQVIDTPLGKLAPMICFENMFPEVAQIYAQQGAEVYLHLTSEGWDPITETRYAWNAARRLHAMQGSAYFLSVNEGDEPSLGDPYHVVGESQAIDPYGRVTAMLRESHPGVLVARVDRALLDTARTDPRSNVAIWDEPGAYAAHYSRGRGVPNNLWESVPAAEFPYRDLAAYKDAVRRFDATGVFLPARRGD